MFVDHGSMHTAAQDGRLCLGETSALSRFAEALVEMDFAPGQICAPAQVVKLHPLVVPNQFNTAIFDA